MKEGCVRRTVSRADILPMKSYDGNTITAPGDGAAEKPSGSDRQRRLAPARRPSRSLVERHLASPS